MDGAPILLCSHVSLAWHGGGGTWTLELHWLGLYPAFATCSLHALGKSLNLPESQFPPL